MEAFLSSNRPSEAPLKASAIKYACEKGSVRFGNPSRKIFNFDPQCERETGRASQADDTPNGVGGSAFFKQGSQKGRIPPHKR